MNETVTLCTNSLSGVSLLTDWTYAWLSVLTTPLDFSQQETSFTYIYNLIFISDTYIYHHHHHHIVLAARISLTLSRHSSLSFIALGRSSGQQPVSSHSCWMYVRAGRPAFARPCVGIHKSTSLMSSSLLLQQCPACLVRLTILSLAIYIYIYIYIWGNTENRTHKQW